MRSPGAPETPAAVRRALERFLLAAEAFARRAAGAPREEGRRIRVLLRERGEVLYFSPDVPVSPRPEDLCRAAARHFRRQFGRLGAMDLWLIEEGSVIAHATAAA